MSPGFKGNIETLNAGHLSEYDLNITLPQEIYGNAELPIAKHREDIIKAVLNNPLIIIESPTGSGKTTQVPQFFLGLKVGGRPAFDQILMTQPRIVTAIETSSRINTEIAEVSDRFITGYNTSIESSEIRQSEQDIAVLTTGKLYAQISGNLNNPRKKTKKTLMIIDEVHLWDLPTEELVALSHAMTDPKSAYYDPNTTVVIMSATLDSDKLQSHFSVQKPPKIKVEVSNFPVDIRTSDKDAATNAVELVKETGGVVIVFVAGKSEIDYVTENITKLQELEKVKSGREPVPIIPLHAQLPREEQSRAFNSYPGGAIIITTNVAETSLTIPEAKAVVDTGEARFSEIRYDLLNGNGSATLRLKDIAGSSAKQRAGRVGRVSEGIYLTCELKGSDKKQKIVSLAKRAEYEIPAIMCESLESMVLKQKSSGIDIADLKFFHEPPMLAINDALRNLYGLGAIDSSGVVTPRGKFMDKLPLDPAYSRMIAQAMEQNYPESVRRNIVDIVSVMQVGGVLERGPRSQHWRKLLKKNELNEIAEQDSDLLVQLEIYINSLKLDTFNREKYNLLDNNIERVQPVRERLYRSLGMQISDVKPVNSDDRQRVLESINAGQINQIWEKSDEAWQLLGIGSEGYKFSPSSVVQPLGKLVTGELFTLGSREGVEYTTIQNVSNVANIDRLLSSAPHLISEIEDDRSVFDHDSANLVVWTKRYLGSISLGGYGKIVENPSIDMIDTAEQELIKANIFRKWLDEQQNIKQTVTTSDLNDEPMQKIYGYHPITKEPLIAWMGGNGKWMMNKDVALESINAQKKAAQKMQLKFQDKPERQEIFLAETALRSIIISNTATKDQKNAARALLNARQHRTRDWLNRSISISKQQNTD